MEGTMKKVILVVFVLVAFCGFSLTAEEQKKEEVPVVKEVTGFWYAYMDFTGPYSDMEKGINTFMGVFFKQGLLIAGPAVSTYYNSPNNVKPEELKWAFGFTVTKDAAVKDPIKLTEFKTKKAVVYLHIGPYEDLPKAAAKATKFAETNGYEIVWPTYDRYLNSPQQVKPGELKTELVIPVKKKEG